MLSQDNVDKIGVVTNVCELFSCLKYSSCNIYMYKVNK